MTTTRYRHRTAEVEAVQWTGSNAAALRAFAGHDFDTIDPEDRIEDGDQDAQVLIEASYWTGISPGYWVLKFEDHLDVERDENFRAAWEPAAVPAVPAAVPPTTRTAVRDRIAEALYERERPHGNPAWSDTYAIAMVRETFEAMADAVLAVLPSPADRAALAEDLRYALGDNGPGHAHEQPGVWDTSGKPCGHCARLAIAQANLAAYDADPDAVLPPPADRAAAPVKQRADCTELEWAEQERARFERLYTRETVRADTAVRDADIYQQRLERLGEGYTRERKRAERAEAESERLRTYRDATCVCQHTEQQHFEDACLACDCGDYLVPEAAREVIARWREAAGKAERIRENADFHLGQEMARRQLAEKEAARLSADRAAVLNAAAQHLYTALFPAVYADMGQKAAEGVDRAVSELRRLADETQQQPDTETPVHIGGRANAEDCPACVNPPYPFHCPGPETFEADRDSQTSPKADSKAGPATPSTPPCTLCTHPKGDHDGHADHRAKYSPLVAGDPWCHACNAGCDYAEQPASAGVQTDEEA